MYLGATIEQMPARKQPVAYYGPLAMRFTPVPPQTPPQPLAMPPKTTPRKDPSSFVSVVVVLCCVGVLIGVMVLTSGANHAQKNTTGAAAQTMHWIPTR